MTVNGVRFAALACLVSMDCPQRESAIEAFETKWSKDELVMQSWFSVQAVCPLEGTLARVRELMKHPVRAANSIFPTVVCCMSCTCCSLTVVFAGISMAELVLYEYKLCQRVGGFIPLEFSVPRRGRIWL